jgi:asparagine synthase (glutamine-hydrolysing)
VSIFACAIQADGGAVPEAFRAGIESSPLCHGRCMAWYAGRGFLGVVDASESGSPPSVVRLGQGLAIGVARLDNRSDIARHAHYYDDEASDLALAARFVMRDDGARIGELLGDYALVVWDPWRRTLLAARDALGVRTLFHARSGASLLTFASRASLLAGSDRYDTGYLLDRVSQSESDSRCTVFCSVGAVQPASLFRVRDGVASTITYWSAVDAQNAAGSPASPREQCDEFRALLIDAVRLRVAGSARAWSLLSGGLDSSSVVSVAQWMAERGAVESGLGGTVTYTDTLGTSADEREFSDAVVQRYQVRNELVPHRCDPRELLLDPPLLDQPNRSYAIALRDRTAARLVRGAGGRVLLTGEGGDALVAGTMFFFADWLVSGRGGEALREMAHRAALGRVSFWRLAYENALMPLLPARMRRLLTRTRVGSIPPWIPAAAVRRFELATRSTLDQAYSGRFGRKYADAVIATIAGIPSVMPLGPADDLLELRHPFLYRPLVELALRLQPEMCVRPHARKWILREAMRGILPESVRTRVGKGALDGLHVWSLTHERQRMDRMLRDPILAQLGVIDRATLSRILDDVRSGRASHEGWRDRIDNTLEIEMWLQLRSGRWAAGDPQSTSTTQVEVARHTDTFTGQSSRSLT